MTTHDALLRRLKEAKFELIDCNMEETAADFDDAIFAITQLQRDNAALMEDAAAQIQIAREAVERAAGLEQPTLEMIQAGLAVRWPALYRDCLYGERDGIHLRAETETRINMLRQQYLAMVSAAREQKEAR